MKITYHEFIDSLSPEQLTKYNKGLKKLLEYELKLAQDASLYDQVEKIQKAINKIDQEITQLYCWVYFYLACQ